MVLGFALVIYGWAMIGTFIELFGIINLFANFFPTAILVLRSMPVIGNILNLPGIKWVADKIQGGSYLPTTARDD
jgi:vesicle transport protein GOT1